MNPKQNEITLKQIEKQQQRQQECHFKKGKSRMKTLKSGTFVQNKRMYIKMNKN